LRSWPDVDPAPDAGGTLWGPAPEFSEPPPGAAGALQGLWREIDEAAADRGASCRACGQCCDFRHQDHVLFAAKIELDVCLAWAAGRAAADARTVRSRLDAGLCPFQREGLCSIRPVRPLGCRLYFCGDRWARETVWLAESSRRRLAEASRRAAVRWWYGPALVYLGRNLPLLTHGS